jgi:hypothetical protein
MHIPSLIFFVYPDPKGSEENQFKIQSILHTDLTVKRDVDDWLLQ